MKNLKLILPMLAMIFAIGLTFATGNPEPEPEMPERDSYALMYVNIDGEWHEIEVDCETGSTGCLVAFDDDPEEEAYPVYNSEDLNDRAIGSVGIKETPTPFPGN